MRQFKIGDEVVWCGLEGLVIDVTYDNDYALSVYFGKNHGVKYFTEDGKSKSYYKIASLKHKEEND